MILRALRNIHKQQGGFTLIEVLVVMTILGILAAIVSISLLGVTANARAKAKLAENQTVQSAFDAMLSDQQVDAATISCPAATNDMTKFPVSKTYTAPDSLGMTALATHYLREPNTLYKYTCVPATGDLVQSGP